MATTNTSTTASPNTRAQRRHPEPTPPAGLERFYTPEEAGAVLRVSRREMYRRLSRGDIAHVVVPGSRRILIPESALTALLDAGRVEGGGEVA